MSDDIRNRFNPPKTRNKSGKPSKASRPSGQLSKASKKPNSDLFSIWDDQRRMDAEEKKMARELAETKKKAKELQKTLRKHKFGESKIALKDNSKATIKMTKDYVNRVKTWIGSRKKKVLGATTLIVGVFVLLAVFIDKPNKTDTLGDSMQVSSQELPREKPEFQLLYPAGSKEDEFEVVRISPDGSAPSYTYVDRLAGDTTVFQVTQQLIPRNFDLEKTARDFQATNVIQIDETKVYHGYSERGSTQSLMFQKNGNLISIRSPQKLTDDQWAGYIISLN